jgi:hypothetical protein
MLSGVALDNVDAWEALSLEQWQSWYAVTAETQLIGFAFLAFTVCPYRRVEFKAASFFMVLWRVFVAAVNWWGLPIFYSPVFLWGCGGFYLAWLLRAVGMKRHREGPAQEGAYYFYMPIHSVWDLVKSVFLPWSMARYESVFIIEGGTMWAVHHERFVIRQVADTNITSRIGVKVWIGRGLLAHERLRLNALIGKRAVPGIRDCRKLQVV